MRAVFLEQAEDALQAVPAVVQRAFKKQLRFLLEDIRHPSLHAKKYNEADDIWQAHVTRGWRFYFTIAHDTYIIIDVMYHPKK